MTYRVLHLVHSDQRRGAEVFATQLACCMEEERLFENAVCRLYYGAGSLPDHGLQVFKLNAREGPLDQKIGLDLRLLFRLYGVLRRFRPRCAETFVDLQTGVADIP